MRMREGVRKRVLDHEVGKGNGQEVGVGLEAGPLLGLLDKAGRQASADLLTFAPVQPGPDNMLEQGLNHRSKGGVCRPRCNG